jgi:hypothetical protein
VDLLPRRLEVARRLVVRVARAVEPVRLLAALVRQEVVQREAQLLRELADRGVALVDQLAPALGDLAVVPALAVRPAATAHAGRGLVHLGDDARLAEPVRGGEPGEARADDDDAARGDGGRRLARERTGARDREAEKPGVAQQLRAGRAPLLGDLLRGVGERPLDECGERCACHRSSPGRASDSCRTMTARGDPFNVLHVEACRGFVALEAG